MVCGSVGVLQLPRRTTDSIGRSHVSANRRISRFCLARGLWIAAVVLGVSVGHATPGYADAVGRPLYGPFKSNEGGEYPRVIRLQHAGAANGMLLATFEHTFRDGSPGYLVIRRSKDDGASWTNAAIISEPNRWPTMWQPSLLELPKRIGQYPEGTILLAENSSTKVDTRIYLFSSVDRSATWQQDTSVVSGAGPKAGVWEPLLLIDGRGALDIFFSDERHHHHRYSQMLGGFVVDEHANAFDRAHEVALAASDGPTDRPGMVKSCAFSPFAMVTLPHTLSKD